METAKKERIKISTGEINPYSVNFRAVYHSVEFYKVEAKVFFSTSNPNEIFRCKAATEFAVPDEGFDLKKAMDVLTVMYPGLDHVDFRVIPSIAKQ